MNHQRTGFTPGATHQNGATLSAFQFDRRLRTLCRGLIPSPIDQNRCAHWRNPMDMMRQG